VETHDVDVKDNSSSCKILNPLSATVDKVRPQFTAGAILTRGRSMCYNGDPSLIGSSTAASYGDGVITYE
jgi:hypothetical protein